MALLILKKLDRIGLMLQKLLIATKNPGKLAEISSFLSDLPVQILSLADINIVDDVIEDGKDYFENSLKKAKFYAEKSGLPTISDDGGLEIAALGGAPGVKSRRWLGHAASDEELIDHMIKVAKELPDDNRNAKFLTVVTLYYPDRKFFQEKGEVEGIIAKEPLLKYLKGYPYRSFFYLPQLKKYYHESELSEKEMLLYNHRRKAIEKIKERLRNRV